MRRTATWMCVALMIVAVQPPASAQRNRADVPVVTLWSEGAPGALGDAPEDRPTLDVYLAPADRANGTAVVVLPGGGYRHLAVDHEGVQVARWLNSLGISAFVLKYRLGPKYRHPVMLGDARRAVRTVRASAREYRIDPHRLGIWGFSAGGHLAATTATEPGGGDASATDPIERESSRPDFAILGYPVITFVEEAYVHAGSREALLGPDPDPALARALSAEQRVTSETPPVFLFHTTSDATVPVENSVLFYQALRKAGVPAELHIYERGPHGVGLAPTDAILGSWTDRLADWLRVRGLLDRATPPASGSAAR